MAPGFCFTLFLGQTSYVTIEPIMLKKQTFSLSYPKHHIFLGVLAFCLFLLPHNAFANTDLTACGTLSSAGETYDLQNDIGSGGDCLIIAADNITINGNDRAYTITGNVVGDSVDPNFSGHPFTIHDAIVVGDVTSNGADGDNGDNSNPGNITLYSDVIHGFIKANGGSGYTGGDGIGANGGFISIDSSYIDLNGGKSIQVVAGSGSDSYGTNGNIEFSNSTTIHDAHGTVTAMDGTYGGLSRVANHWIMQNGILSYNTSYLEPGNISSCGVIYFAGTYTLTSNVSAGVGTCFSILTSSVNIDAASHSITGNVTGNGQSDGEAGFFFLFQTLLSRAPLLLMVMAVGILAMMAAMEAISRLVILP
jgi:hypothetical protein